MLITVRDGQRVDPIEIAATEFGVSAKQITGPGRKRGVVVVRHLICYTLVHHYNMTMSRTGRLLGGRDHSTISHAVSVFGRDMDVDPNLRQMYYIYCRAIREQA